MRPLLVWLIFQAIAFATDWKAGAEQSVTTPSFSKPARVFLPQDWTPDHSWPDIIFYAWTGGQADTATMRRHTDGRDFIIVGMPPRDDGPFSYTPEALRLEQKALGEMRERLSHEIGLDPARVYVAGFSKGGWLTGLLLAHTPGLAGGCIMGGGWIEHQHEPPKKFTNPVYIYIGDGRLDGNYPPSLRASREFAKLGARITFDVWPDTGHTLPKDGSEGLRQWLALIARGAKAREEAALWAPKELARIQALHDSVEQWTELQRFTRRPFVRALGEEISKPASAQIADLQRIPAVAAEASLVAELEAINDRETQDMKVTTLENVGPRYEALAVKSPASPAGKLAAHDAARIKQLWKTVQP